MALLLSFLLLLLFLHFLQTTNLYLIQDNVWGIWHRIELNDSTFEQQNKWSMQLLERLQLRSQGSLLPALRTDGKEIAPEDAEKLWVSLVQSQIVAQQTNDEAIDFKLSSRCACRMLQERRTLGITERNLIY